MHCLVTFSFISFLACLVSATRIPPFSSSTRPLVDLGYTIHEALSSDNDATYYNFSNIRFGAPPTGRHRFRAPQEPTINRTVNSGMDLNIQCPQATPKWNSDALQQIVLLEEALLSGNRTLYEAVLAGVRTVTETKTSGPKPSNNTTLAPEPATGEMEDCLFLDVMVPHSSWSKRHNARSRKAPVLIWLYGGGYVEGSKRDASPLTLAGFAKGMVERSIATANASSEGVIEPTIVVIPNYRLGLFGWLGGETVASKGVLNAGLLDQKLAFEWVQKNIHLFGGDPERVTVVGESAGGGSIMFHVTANGGEGAKLPFTGAVMQSPTFFPQSRRDHRPEAITRAILKATNTTTLEELRTVSFEDLWEVNANIVGGAAYGFFNFGPVIDGRYVLDLPGRLLFEGRFHKDVRLMIGHNSNEGFLFTPPSLPNTTSSFEALVRQQFPTADTTATTWIDTSLYPPDFSGKQGYINEFGRQEILYVESQFVCNNLWLSQALPERTYWYTFKGPPGYHGQDIPYTWADYPPKQSILLNATVASTLQEWTLSFAASGEPKSSAANVPFLPYGGTRNIVTLGNEGILNAQDDTSEARCCWWQRAPYA